MKIEGLNALVTGSTGLLGMNIAVALAKAGCNCVCHYNTNKTLADDLVEQIKAVGVNAVGIGCDLSNAGQIEPFFAKASQLGQIRILINSAAIFNRRPLAEITPEYTQEILNANLTAPMLISKFFAEALGQSASLDPIAKIINIADVGGIKPWAQYSVYCASKAGLIGVTKSMAKELAPSVCVNAIAPGIVNWPSDFDNNEKARQIKFIPAARIGSPDDITNAVIFLLKNDYITGQTIAIDGGRAM